MISDKPMPLFRDTLGSKDRNTGHCRMMGKDYSSLAHPISANFLAAMGGRDDLS